MRRSKTNDFNVRNDLCSRPNNHEELTTMTNQDNKISDKARPTRADMLAFVANGRPRPTAQWAICVKDSTWAICVSDRRGTEV